MKKILITGIGGFIGSYIANFFASRGEEVWGIYRSKRPVVGEKVKLIQHDLRKPLLLEESFNVVFHLAAQVEGGKVYDYIDNTICTTRNVVHFCERNKIDFLVLFSSIAVYGETDVEVNEFSDKKNLSPYGMAKVFSERIVEESDIKTRFILRCPRILGPGMDLSYKWIPALVKSLNEDTEITYFNPELLYNNMADVDDLAYFCNTLLHNHMGMDVCETIVFGAKDKMKVIDIILYLKELLQSSSVLTFVQGSKKTVFAIDNKKAIRYGYRPRESHDILERLVNCF